MAGEGGGGGGRRPGRSARLAPARGAAGSRATISCGPSGGGGRRGRRAPLRSAALRRARPRCRPPPAAWVLGAAPETIEAGSTHAPAPGPPGPPPLTPALLPAAAAWACARRRGLRVTETPLPGWALPRVAQASTPPSTSRPARACSGAVSARRPPQRAPPGRPGPRVPRCAARAVRRRRLLGTVCPRFTGGGWGWGG